MIFEFRFKYANGSPTVVHREEADEMSVAMVEAVAQSGALDGLQSRVTITGKVVAASRERRP